MPSRYQVRAATPSDGPAFLALVHELAVFEKLDPPPAAAQARLLADAFGPARRIEVLLGVDGPEVVAYAIFIPTYSSFLAKPTMYLEDLYVSPAHRGTGLANLMLERLASIAVERDWGRLEGIVLTWNEVARRFYAKTGAKELEEWRFFRYDREALERLSGP